MEALGQAEETTRAMALLKAPGDKSVLLGDVAEEWDEPAPTRRFSDRGSAHRWQVAVETQRCQLSHHCEPAESNRSLTLAIAFGRFEPRLSLLSWRGGDAWLCANVTLPFKPLIELPRHLRRVRVGFRLLNGYRGPILPHHYAREPPRALLAGVQEGSDPVPVFALEEDGDAADVIAAHGELQQGLEASEKEMNADKRLEWIAGALPSGSGTRVEKTCSWSYQTY